MVLYLASSFVLMLLLVLLLFQLQKSAKADGARYETCKQPFECGNLSISYPFYNGHERPDYCGYPGFELDCSQTIPEISVSSTENYYVVGIKNDAPIVTVARKDYWDGYCPKTQNNTSINFTLFDYTSSDENITLYYECSDTSTPRNQFLCSNIGEQPVGYFVTDEMKPSLWYDIPFATCKRNIFVPFTNYDSSAASITDTVSLMTAFRKGFELEWFADNSLCDECSGSGGVCGYNSTTSRFTCYCPDQPYDTRCPGNNYSYQPDTKDSGSSKMGPSMAPGAVIGGIAGGLGLLILVCCCSCMLVERRNYSSYNQLLAIFQQKKNQDVEALLRNYGAASPKRYAYRDLKKITNSFKDKLGEGGFGAVYRGKLQNGDLVAVKFLKKSKGDAEEFINEVTNIGKTNHINIVRLVGFCYEGRKRALVYNFMPNGSLEKFIYGRNNYQPLAWENLFQIAIGIARGLEYLHRGCNTRILHFDIKPHNILLDENYCPKISDFGLAKSCSKEKSIISLSEARGTVGYIAPEVFLRGYGGVSQKSDVYSYGMLVLDMVGCRNKVNNGAESHSEQYFPQWIYKQLEEGEEFDDQGMLSGEDRELRRRMVLVSLWCIQTHPSSRPTMTRVVEMLEGAIESLPIPPMPFLASPLRSQHNSSTIPTISIALACQQGLSGTHMQQDSIHLIA